MALLPKSYLKTWVCLLVGVKPKSRRRKDLLLSTSKEIHGDLSQTSVSPNRTTEEVLSIKELWAVRVQTSAG